MDLLPSSEQDAIVAVATDFLSRELPVALIRERRHDVSAYDRTTWKRCAGLGWFALGLPEGAGGVGYALADEALLFGEIGRSLASGPFVATVLGARVASAAGQAELLGRIVEGDAVVALAEPADGAAAGEAVVGEAVSGRYRLLDAEAADLVLVVTPDAAALVETAHLCHVEHLTCIDPGARLAWAALESAPALATTTADLEPSYLRGGVLAAAGLAGIAMATRDMGAEHAKNRVQFGQPIGVNQAIKHRCADMALRAEAAHSQLLFAALTLEGGGADAAFQVAAAKAVAGDAAVRNAGDNIQIHGGMGFAFEHDSNLYLRRAHVMDRMFGSLRDQLRRLVDLPAPTS